MGGGQVTIGQLGRSEIHSPKPPAHKGLNSPKRFTSVILFELNGLDASIWVPWSPSDPKKS